MVDSAGAFPRASILVVCHRRADMLARCVASIRQHVSPAVSYEILVLLNGMPLADRERVTRGLSVDRVVEAGVNLGFPAGNNRLAAMAKGEFLVFLNDDTEVRPGWLEALAQTADAHPAACAVGSRILHPDGSLQEAGSIVWSDGSTVGVGRGLPPGSRRYEYLREVDYVSACSLLVRRSAFETLGGFDERFFPGYLEDVDFCLAIRSGGGRVLYQPRSVVIHHESQSSPESKDFLILRGRRTLRDKWAAELGYRSEAKPWDQTAIELAVHRARDNPRRLLIVDDRLPDPGAGSGLGRMLDAIRELSTAGYAISLYPTADARGPRDTVQDLGVDVVEEDLVDHLSAPHVSYDIAIVSRPNNFDAIKRLRRLQPQCAVIYDAEALFHRRLEREGAVLQQTDPEGALLVLGHAKRMKRLEERIARIVDRVVAVSSVEAQALEQMPRHRPIDVIEGRSLDARMGQRLFERRRGMVFVAGWLAPYPSPNSDGLEWFLEEVLPLVKQPLPWAELRVTGAKPPAELARHESPAVKFVGHVEDLGELYDSVRVAIVPERYGAGIKNKALEAVLHGVPVVATTVGAEGVLGAGGPGVLVADEPERFASRLVGLLDDRRTWNAVRAALERRDKDDSARPATWPGVVEKALKERTLASVAV